MLGAFVRDFICDKDAVVDNFRILVICNSKGVSAYCQEPPRRPSHLLCKTYYPRDLEYLND